jgi:hypothetical protein
MTKVEKVNITVTYIVILTVNLLALGQPMHKFDYKLFVRCFGNSMDAIFCKIFSRIKRILSKSKKMSFLWAEHFYVSLSPKINRFCVKIATNRGARALRQLDISSTCRFVNRFINYLKKTNSLRIT